MSPARIRFRYALVLAGSLPAAPAAAQPVTILHSFAVGAADGQSPTGSLTVSGSALYGMTPAGGTAGDGTVFKINTDGTGFGVLHSFTGGLNDGNDPNGSLIPSGSTLYGMTSAGGSASNTGTVFQINTDGTGFSLLHRFQGGPADGLGPLGTPAMSGPTLYGMTPQGGAANLGTVFKVNTDGTGFGLAHSFAGGPADGQLPGFSAPVVAGPAVYGMTIGGGAVGEGAVFRMNADGTGFAVLHSFTPATGDGWQPQGSLTLSGSTLYGMTRFGGGAAGTVFKVNTDGTGYTILHSFLGQSGGDGANPLGSLLLVGSTLYGTTAVGGTANLGTVFQMNADGTGYRVLHSFAGGPFDGNDPQGDLTLVGSALYGMTAAGGASNLGTIFSLPIAVPEPSALALAAAGALGALIRPLRRFR